MNALIILIVGFALLIIGYKTYGTWLEKQWGVDDSVPTPAQTMQDGVDYVPAAAPVLIGHHFSSIAGAGPINGPIQAAFFGWLPCFLWIVIGGIFFGAVHDFGALFASIRHKGASIGQIISENIGDRAKKLFIVFAYLTLLLVVAAFASIVAGTFNSVGKDGAINYTNASTATISAAFIVMAIVFGLLVYRQKLPLAVCTVIGIAVLVACIVFGEKNPLFFYDNTTWMYILGVYILIASVTPVWILLQPRDYLSSFLLYGIMIAAVVGVVAAHPSIELPAFVGFEVNGKYLFPVLFVTIACGAISGFHSLVSSGTTAKQLSREKDAKLIGYGSMLIECALAVISLICIGYVYSKSGMGNEAFKIPPTAVFATGISEMLGTILPSAEAQKYAYNIMILAVSAFCLTSLDTATRLARYMFQEFWTKKGENPEDLTGIRAILVNKYVATIITVVLGVAFGLGGWSRIWPLFGAANQLLAGLALLAVASWLKNAARNHRMLIGPMIFMLCVTLTSLGFTIQEKAEAIMEGKGDAFANYLQGGLGAILFVLAFILVYEALPVLTGKNTANAKA